MGTDTIDNSGQAHEDTLLAMAEAGLLPGVREFTRTDVPDPSTLVLYRIPRNACDIDGGLLAAKDILRLSADGYKGRLMLSFDGWAGDDRALAQIPQAVRCCAALLLGPAHVADPAQASTDHAGQILAALMDEQALGRVVGDMAWGAAGRAWLVAHAWADSCFLHAAHGDGLMRDISRNLLIMNVIQQGLQVPGAGRALQ